MFFAVFFVKFNAPFHYLKRTYPTIVSDTIMVTGVYEASQGSGAFKKLLQTLLFLHVLQVGMSQTKNSPNLKMAEKGMLTGSIS